MSPGPPLQTRAGPGAGEDAAVPTQDRHVHAQEAETPGACPDFGDVQDNATALHIALYEIQRGHSAWGCEVLRSLRDHILATREVKSLQWLLPRLENAIRCLCSTTNPARQAAHPS